MREAESKREKREHNNYGGPPLAECNALCKVNFGN